jgi:hypothetical protein
VVHDLQQRLAPDYVPVFTSDGLHLYFYALTAHFGRWVQGVGRQARQWQVAAELIYGQVKKIYRRRKLVRVTHIMRCGTRVAPRGTLMGLGLSGLLNTAFVERVNLTLRQSIAALTRRTWSTMQAAPQLLAHVDMVVCVLPLRATASVAPAGAGPANRVWRPAAAAALSTTDACDGRRADRQALEGTRGADAPAPTGAARRWVGGGRAKLDASPRAHQRSE